MNGRNRVPMKCIYKKQAAGQIWVSGLCLLRPELEDQTYVTVVGPPTLGLLCWMQGRETAVALAASLWWDPSRNPGLASVALQGTPQTRGLSPRADVGATLA